VTILWPAARTPYVTPDQLSAGMWPVAVDFSTLPPGTQVTQAQRLAALTNVCLTATAQVDGELNFPLHCIMDTEQEQGPDYRVTVRNSTREGRVILSRWPVTSIVSVKVAPAGVSPLQWTTVPAGFYRPEYPVIGHPSSNTPSGSGEGGQAILVAPGYITWCNGRWGTVVSVTYTHGWPHTALAAGASPATPTQTVSVDDCTGWGPFSAGLPGATGIIYDGATGQQEPITVTAASATSGPGTLTLASELNFSHGAGVMVSTLPSDAIWATALFAGAEALTRGAQSTTVQTTPGHGGGGSGAHELKGHAWDMLSRFRRTI